MIAAVLLQTINYHNLVEPLSVVWNIIHNHAPQLYMSKYCCKGKGIVVPLCIVSTGHSALGFLVQML